MCSEMLCVDGENDEMWWKMELIDERGVEYEWGRKMEWKFYIKFGYQMLNRWWYLDVYNYGWLVRG